jgi:hypothetical protein
MRLIITKMINFMNKETDMSKYSGPAADIDRLQLDPGVEEFLAELTDAAYQVALKNGIVGSFINVQLGLWSALRGVVARRACANEARKLAVS